MEKKNSLFSKNSSVLEEKEKGTGFSSLNLREWLMAIFVALITFIIFIPAISNDFVNWDDDTYVFGNSHIRSIDSKFFIWIFQFHASNWHPLTWLSHAIDYSLWGLKPAGHHASSIILHSINTFLLSILIVLMILNLKYYESSHSEPDSGIRTRAIVAGGVTALLFGIHPLHVESVAWVAERKDILCAFFVLLSIISYVIYVLRPGTNKKSFYYISSLVFFISALMSKPMAVTIPFVLVILDIYPFRRLSLSRDFASKKKVIIEKIPFLFFSLLSAVLTIMAQHAGGAIKSLKAYPLSTQIALAVKGLYFYLVKMILPIRLSPFYPYPKEISFVSLEYLTALLVVGFITIFTVWAYKKGFMIFIAVWTYYVITLLPVIGIVRIGDQAAADRYTYIPSIGPFLLVGLGVAIVYERIKGKEQSFVRGGIAVFLPLVLLFCLLGTVTINQMKVWRNSITLWTTVLNRFPDFRYGYISRANAYMALGKYNEALYDLNSVIKFNPDYPGAYNSRGFVHRAVRDYKSAIADFSKAIELNPEYASAYSNRAEMYIRLGEPQKGLKDLDKAIELEPDESIYYLNKCEINKVLANYQEAVKDCSKALEINPENDVAYNNIGSAFYALGNYPEAIFNYDKSITINPNNPKVYFVRGMAYSGRGEYQKAIVDFSKAIDLNPKFADAYINRGIAYGELGILGLKKAIEDFTRAIELSPGEATAYYNRGAAYYRLGKEKEAKPDFQKAARLGDKTIQQILRARGINW